MVEMKLWLGVRRRVAEDVVEAAQPGAQAVTERLEHMFG
jgi:hypothetical protein